MMYSDEEFSDRELTGLALEAARKQFQEFLSEHDRDPAYWGLKLMSTLHYDIGHPPTQYVTLEDETRNWGKKEQVNE